jgi:alanine racemase
MTSRIEIDRSKMDFNLQNLQKVNPKTKLAICIKANAYGHGIKPIAKYLNTKPEVEYLLIANKYDFQQLKTIKNTKQTLLLYTFDLDDLKYSLKYPWIEFPIYNQESLLMALNFAQDNNHQLKIHLNIDTGLHCFGCNLEELDIVYTTLKENSKYLSFKGIFSHFSDSDNLFSDYYWEQVKTFQTALKMLDKYGLQPELVHIQNSAAYLRQDIDFGKWNDRIMSRIGICFYGFYPTKETTAGIKKMAQNNGIHLRPIASLVTPITNIKYLQKGESISYGQAFFCQRDSVIATISLGYSEGINRAWTNKLQVQIGQKFFPTVGRIRMNMVAIDVTDNKSGKIRVGTEVKLYTDQQNLEDLLIRSEQIIYEYVTTLPKYLPRKLI